MILWRACTRFYRHQPMQLIIAVMGVALGVMLVVAIDLANDSAFKAIQLSTQAMGQQSGYSIQGGPAGIDESHYPALRKKLLAGYASPIIDGVIYIENFKQHFRLLGIDPLSYPSSSPLNNNRTKTQNVTQLLRPNAVMMAAPYYHQLQKDKILRAMIKGQLQRLTVVDDYSASQATKQSIIITDIATAQSILGMSGVLSRIDLQWLDSPSHWRDEDIQRIEHQLPPGLWLVQDDQQLKSKQQMTRAFQRNLQAMSFLAVLVGAFLIFNTMRFAVIQRRKLLGILRALGVTQKQVMRQILMEAVVMGLLGGVLGITMGIWLAHILIQLMTQTINDLYFSLTVNQLNIDILLLLKGMLTGLLFSVIAAFWPAWESANSTPITVMMRSSIETRFIQRLNGWALLGIVFIIIAYGFFQIPDQYLIFGFAGVFILVSGFVMMTPLLIVILSRLITSIPIIKQSLAIMIATRNIEASLSRTGVAIAAMAVALAASLGMGMMIDSFRQSVNQWLDNYIRADYYITPVVGQSDLTSDVVKWLTALKGVDAISLTKRTQITTPSQQYNLLAIDLPKPDFTAFKLLSGHQDQASEQFYHQQQILISESLSFHQQLKVGDAIRLPTRLGQHDFNIAGIYKDYSADRGLITMHRNTYMTFWHDKTLNNVGLYLDVQADSAALLNQIQAAGFNATDSHHIKAVSIDIFNRTFAVTHVIQLLAIIVAMMGVVSALMAIIMEQSQVYAVLRATGITRLQLVNIMISQSMLMGILAIIMAIPLGILLAQVLIDVINQRSFGWTMPLLISPGVLLQPVMLALIASLVACIYPAYKLNTIRVSDMLRME